MKNYEVNLLEYTEFKDVMPEEGIIIDAFRLTSYGDLESHCERRFYKKYDIDTTSPLTHYKIIGE